MIYVYKKEPVMQDWHELVGYFTDERNRLSLVYPNNPEMLAKYDELMVQSAEVKRISDYRIKGRQVVIKPLCLLSLDKQIVKVGEQVNLTINISDLVEGEIIPEIEFLVNGITDPSFKEALTNNSVIIPFTFNDPMMVEFSVGKHFRSSPIKLEVLPLA